MSETSKPNIFWIFSDQQPAHMLGIAGNPELHTPNIDILARRGTRFENAVSGYPLCCPFRGSLLSSRYPHEAVPAHEAQLSPELPTVADAFSAHGYRTAWFGKWHVDGFKENDGPDGRAAKHLIPAERRGRFHDWLGYENNNFPWDSWVHGNIGGTEIPHEKLDGYEIDALTNRFIDYLSVHAAQRPDTPLFAALSVQPPHDPNHAPAEDASAYRPADISLRPNVPQIPWVERKARESLAGAYGQMANFDRNIGSIITHLDYLGLLDNSVVFHFSDHGDMHGSHGLWEKMQPYAEATNIPFIVTDFRPKLGYPTDRNCVPYPINHVDILPTSLGMAGLEIPDFCRGSDFSSAVLNPRGHDPESMPQVAYLQAISEYGPNPPWRGIATSEGFSYFIRPDGPWHSYDHPEDPFELHNLAQDYRQLKKLSQLHRLLTEHTPPMECARLKFI
jgi:arylsulfatase A-like enzyme